MSLSPSLPGQWAKVHYTPGFLTYTQDVPLRGCRGDRILRNQTSPGLLLLGAQLALCSRKSRPAGPPALLGDSTLSNRRLLFPRAHILWPLLLASCSLSDFLCSVHFFSPLHVIITDRPQAMHFELYPNLWSTI